MFKELKANTDNQIPFATANNIELFEEVCQGHLQKRSVETALRNAESSLAEEKSRVSALESCLAEEKSHVSALESSLAKEKSHVCALRSSLAKEKSCVSALEATNAAQDQLLQRCHDRYKKLLEAEKTEITQLEDVIKEKNQRLHNAKLQVQKYKEGASQTHKLTTLVCL